MGGSLLTIDATLGRIQYRIAEIENKFNQRHDYSLKIDSSISTEKLEKAKTGSSNQERTITTSSSELTSFDDLFQLYANKYGVDSDLAKAVAKAESDFNPQALSSTGAQGIMQLMPETAKSLGVDDPFNPEKNIAGGIRYLRGMLDKFGGNTELALAAYNAGSGNVEKYGGIPPFSETKNYIKAVQKYYQQMKHRED